MAVFCGAVAVVEDVEDLPTERPTNRATQWAQRRCWYFCKQNDRQSGVKSADQLNVPTNWPTDSSSQKPHQKSHITCTSFVLLASLQLSAMRYKHTYVHGKRGRHHVEALLSSSRILCNITANAFVQCCCNAATTLLFQPQPAASKSSMAPLPLLRVRCGLLVNLRLRRQWCRHTLAFIACTNIHTYPYIHTYSICICIYAYKC